MRLEKMLRINRSAPRFRYVLCPGIPKRLVYSRVSNTFGLVRVFSLFRGSAFESKPRITRTPQRRTRNKKGLKCGGDFVVPC